ncbi:MAG: right-handed parallel beta-helix repeat-containing protein [Verrucomicrobiota bacterium]
MAACGIGWVFLTGGAAEAAQAFRWAESSNRIYVSGSGTVTLSQIQDRLPNAPLRLADAPGKIWELDSTLILQEGARLVVRGGTTGDVNQLRLLSQPDNFVRMIADYGSFHFESTRVTSWDGNNQRPDGEVIDGRASVIVKSRMNGGLPGNSSLIVRNSHFLYLGNNSAEEAAINWKRISSDTELKVSGEISGTTFSRCVINARDWEWPSVRFTNNRFEVGLVLDHDSEDPRHVEVFTDQVDPFPNGFAALRAKVRWAASSNTIYVTGPGKASLSDIKDLRQTAPLDELGDGVWLLRSNLVIENGAQLVLHGFEELGDVEHLRLLSENRENGFVRIMADWGSIDIRGTRITSWDPVGRKVDEETETFGRANIAVRSRLDKVDGVTPRESRMDIFDSEIGYLGYQASESYGLSWKVLGFDGVDQSIFEEVEVYGDIQNSEIHHNHFGVYTYGLSGGQWENNEVHHNIVYGFDPHDDSDDLLIRNNVVHHNGSHGIIASKRCDHLRIIGNRSYNNAFHGIMLHRECDDTVVDGNECFDNGLAGIAIFATNRCLIINNQCLRNGDAGIRFTVGASDNVVYGNVLDGNETGFSFFKGNDPPNPGEDGRPKRNRLGAFVDLDGNGELELVGNTILNSLDEAVRMIDGDGNVIQGNAFSVDRAGQPASLLLVDSDENLLRSNDFSAASVVELVGEDLSTTTYFENQESLRIVKEGSARAVFRDDTSEEENSGPVHVVDGRLDEWSRYTSVIDYVDVPAGHPIDVRELYLGENEDRFFVGLLNQRPVELSSGYLLFFDTDKNAATGFGVHTLGADYLVQGQRVFRFSGNRSSDWRWDLSGEATTAEEGNVVEWGFPKSWLGSPLSFEYVFYGDNTDVGPNAEPDNVPDDSWETPLIYTVRQRVEEVTVQIDGGLGDWSFDDSYGRDPEDVFGPAAAKIDIVEIFLKRDGPDLVFAYKNAGDALLNEGWLFFLNTDQNRATGFDLFDFGSDYLIQNRTVYRFAGADTGRWAWTYVGKIEAEVKGPVIEGSFPVSLVGDPAWVEFFFFGDNSVNGFDGVDLFPDDPGTGLRFPRL